MEIYVKQSILDENIDTGIKPLSFGHEQCRRNHRFGPYIRDYYLIHFCLNGKGTLIDKYGTHHVKKGQLFIIRPDEVTTYFADGVEPWEYVWIAFSGRESVTFDEVLSVQNSPNNLERTLLEYVKDNVTSAMAYKSFLYQLIYQLDLRAPIVTDTVQKIKQYVDLSYMEQLSVKTISNTFGYERSYLYRIFKKQTGKSIKEYINSVRLSKAKVFLKDGHSVNETALMVGFLDPFNFSKAYKKYFGKSPISEKLSCKTPN